jgi:hypothetical protein
MVITANNGIHVGSNSAITANNIVDITGAYLTVSGVNNIFESLSNGNNFLMSQANLDALKNDPNNYFVQQPGLVSSLPSLNEFNNAAASSPSQVKNFTVITVTKVIDETPALPQDPCGDGSSLVFKFSNGVIPNYSELVPFSVISSQQALNTSTLLTLPEMVNLASNTSKKISCDKG